MQNNAKYSIISNVRKNIAFFVPYSLYKSGLLIHKEVKIMNKYESVVIINPSVTEDAMKEVIKKYTDIINNEGKVESVDEMGKKRLAYEIKKNKEGYYVVFHFEAKPELIAELERNYRIDDDVLKFITVKNED